MTAQLEEWNSFIRSPQAIRCESSARRKILHMDNLVVELEREVDGRWIADIPSLPGVMVYGETIPEALVRLAALLAELRIR